MRLISMTLVLTLAALVAACAPVEVSVGDDDVGEQRQQLEGEDCRQQCDDQFHACRESGGGGGPGASGCAHERNDCKDRC